MIRGVDRTALRASLSRIFYRLRTTVLGFYFPRIVLLFIVVVLKQRGYECKQKLMKESAGSWNP